MPERKGPPDYATFLAPIKIVIRAFLAKKFYSQEKIPVKVSLTLLEFDFNPAVTLSELSAINRLRAIVCCIRFGLECLVY